MTKISKIISAAERIVVSPTSDLVRIKAEILVSKNAVRRVSNMLRTYVLINYKSQQYIADNHIINHSYQSAIYRKDHSEETGLSTIQHLLFLLSHSRKDKKSLSFFYVDQSWEDNKEGSAGPLNQIHAKSCSNMNEFNCHPEEPLQLNAFESMEKTRDRFFGCILGGAVGDALGAPVEFMQRDEIILRFGAEGIHKFALSFGGIGTITDDTQMTLFTAEGLIRGWVHQCFYGTADYGSITSHAYLRWLQTQGETLSCDIDFAADEQGWLIQQTELHNRRAPGITCISSLKSMTSLGRLAMNESKGCGGVMRVAPVGLFASRLSDQLSAHDCFRLGADLAALTHGHPTGYLTAGVLSVLILLLVSGESLRDALSHGRKILVEMPNHEETLRALDLAVELASTNTPTEKAINQLGRGWIAEEALAISIYCALVCKNLEQGVILAVNHDGDSDSTGAITGNLLGALHGIKSIPEEWLNQLELGDVLREVADDLFSFRNWDIGSTGKNSALNQNIWWKYPGF